MHCFEREEEKDGWSERYGRGRNTVEYNRLARGIERLFGTESLCNNIEHSC